MPRRAVTGPRTSAMAPRTMPEAKEALRFQAALLDAVGQALIATDTAGIVVYWNKAAEELYEWPAAEAMGQDVADLVVSDLGENQPAIMAALVQGESWSGDIWVTRRDGSRFRAHVVDTPVYGRDGSLVAIIGVSLDVTDREAGGRARSWLAAIVEQSGDAILGVTPDGLVSGWNRAAEELFGFTADEMVGQSISVLTPEDRRAEQAEVRARLAAGGPSEYLETVRCRKDGSRVDVAISASGARDGEGRVVGQAVIARDITARRVAQQALERSRRRLAEAQAIAQVGSFGIDLTTGVMEWSDEHYRILGLEVGSAATVDRFLPLVHPDDVDELNQCWAEAMQEGMAFDLSYRIIRPDGDERCVRGRVHPERGQDGTVVSMVGTLLDETDRVQAEQKRRSADERYRAIIETAGEGIWAIDADGLTTFVNGRVAAMLGYAVEEIVGTSVFDYMVAESQAIAVSVLGRSNTEEAAQLDFRFKARDGSDVWVLAETTALTDSSGREGTLGMFTDITSRHRDEERLRRSEQSLADAQQVAHIGSFDFDMRTGVLAWSDEHFRILGLDPQLEPSPALFLGVIHPDDLAELDAKWEAAFREGIGFDLAYRIIRPDSEERRVRSRIQPETAEDGAVVRLFGTLMDETERIEAERVRQAAEARFQLGFEQGTIGIAIFDLDGYPVEVNPAMCILFGRSSDELIGRRLADFGHPDDVTLFSAASAAVAAGHDAHDDERRYLRPDGSVVWASTHIHLVRDQERNPLYYFAQLDDITDRKEMEEELAHQALHDPLTGLPNRALLTDRLSLGLAGTRRRESGLAVMLLDVDHLKLLNDASGHAAGDEVLRHISDCIADTLRPGDTAARFGADEFAMVCEDVSAEEANEIAERVLECLRGTPIIGDTEMPVSASIGIAIAEARDTPESLLRDADAAMYRAKERGRGRIELFDDALRAKAARRSATELELRRALDREEFAVYFQPVVDLASDAVVSAEALVRWIHPERGLVPPDEFIPLAEETGLIVPMGAWVLNEACLELAGWQQKDSSLSVAVNLSVRQMAAPGVVEMVRRTLERTGIQGSDLCLELTESVWMEDVDYFGRILARFKALGCRLSIDDFGTAYSSLSYLKRFPVDEVKVDRGFVDGLGTDPHDSALVGAIVAMAEALGLEVTAEGVETHDQLTSLKALHCQRAQGYFLARPMPAEDMRRLVGDGGARLPEIRQ